MSYARYGHAGDVTVEIDGVGAPTTTVRAESSP